MSLVGGSPSYIPIDGFEAPDTPARTYRYSDDGRLFVYALSTSYVPLLLCLKFDPIFTSSVRIYLAEGAQLLRELQLPNVVEIKFSPRGTYLSTWERPGQFSNQ
jgi:translation initiation factor 2A